MLEGTAIAQEITTTKLTFKHSRYNQPSTPHPYQLLDHEKLDVYHISVEFVVLANSFVENMPRGRGYLCDQLQRAALSITLNIAEGAGEFSTDEKSRFYRMAKRSATECAGILDVAQKLQLIDQKNYSLGRELLIRIVSILIKMVQKSR